MDQYLTYTLIAPKRPGNVVAFTFFLDGKFRGMFFNENADANFIKKICDNVPLDKSTLQSKVFEGCIIRELSDINTSFGHFWNEYEVKVGNKRRVESKWNALSQDDRIMALSHIRRYRQYCQKKGIEMCYPETYINGRRWEDQLPA